MYSILVFFITYSIFVYIKIMLDIIIRAKETVNRLRKDIQKDEINQINFHNFIELVRNLGTLTYSELILYNNYIDRYFQRR